jgi:hypothetical protein
MTKRLDGVQSCRSITCGDTDADRHRQTGHSTNRMEPAQIQIIGRPWSGNLKM